jgi:phosphoribosylanthranilate isomerase
VPNADELSVYSSSLGFLVDSNEPGALGGTGHVFDWSRLDNNLPKPLILAGGLNVNNIETAIVQVSPYAVDVSSGVELEKGIKCEHSMRAFMQAVADADTAKHARLNSTENSAGWGGKAESSQI